MQGWLAEPTLDSGADAAFQGASWEKAEAVFLFVLIRVDLRASVFRGHCLQLVEPTDRRDGRAPFFYLKILNHRYIGIS